MVANELSSLSGHIGHEKKTRHVELVNLVHIIFDTSSRKKGPCQMLPCFILVLEGSLANDAPVGNT